MSDQIKALAPQFWEMTPHGLQFNQVRFAETIVRNCVDLINSSGTKVQLTTFDKSIVDYTKQDAVRAITQHFRVTE